jgi:hypothetical protein
VTAIAVISNIIPVTAKFETGDGVFAGKFPSGRLTENRYQRIELARVGQVNGHVCRRPPGCRFLISLLLAVACLMAWPKRLPGQSRSSNFEVTKQAAEIAGLRLCGASLRYSSISFRSRSARRAK